MRRRAFLLAAAPLVIGEEAARPAEVFKKVRLRTARSSKDNRLTSKDVHLTVDEQAGKLTLKYVYEERTKPVEIKLAKITKAVLETTSHGRDAIPLGGVIGIAVASKKVRDYWCYFDYRDEQGAPQRLLLEIDKGSAESAAEALRRTLGPRLTEFESVSGEDFDRKTLPDGETKYQATFSGGNPVSEVRPDSALIVAVFPTGSMRATAIHKLHANDKVILGNFWGTYSFAYLPPGEYLFASQCGTANGMKLKVGAGQAYYFVQSARGSLRSAREGSLLSRNSPELVLYEAAGARHVILLPPGGKGGKLMRK